jgi:NAD(P)H-dependent FMN reductase
MIYYPQKYSFGLRMKNQILIINGSIRGRAGNSYKLAQIAAARLSEQHSMSTIIFNLSEPKPSIKEVYALLEACSGFLLVTGSYWNNWGSPLQRFIEVITVFENTPALFGKPVACAVTADSVGGGDLAARLQSVFGGLGCWNPPCSTLLLTRVALEAIAASAGKPDDANEDVWRMDDLDIVLKNLVTASTLKKDQWVSWPHVSLTIPDGEWPEHGDLDLGSPKFI